MINADMRRVQPPQATPRQSPKPVGTRLPGKRCRLSNHGNAHLPDGVTRIAGEGRFVVWGVEYAAAEPTLLGAAGSLARGVCHSDCAGVALDLERLTAPTAERTTAIVELVDELQSAGVSVVLHGASAAFLTAITMENAHWRCASSENLSTSVQILREYDEMRRECTSERGSRIHQLRMPARALSLAPLCLFLHDRLTRFGLSEPARVDLVAEAYSAMGGILEASYGNLEDISASVGVHEGRATVTLLDSGAPRENEIIVPGEDGRVDRIHRFRILDRHNALVLEKDVAVAMGMQGEVSS